MKELRVIIAENICKLRTSAGLTQLGLAEILNYSDKAVSKWERAEALPDVTVLKAIADYFGVDVDYLLRDGHEPGKDRSLEYIKARKRNRVFFSVISVLLVLLAATAAFATLSMLTESDWSWLILIYALPAVFTILLVFNCIWGRRSVNYLVVTFLMWSGILSAYLTVLVLSGMNFWFLFVVGAPLQIILLFVPGITFVKYRIRWGKNR